MKVIISGYVGKKITGIGRNLINILNNIDFESDDRYIIYCNYDMYEEFSSKLNSNIIVKTYNVSKNSSFKNLLWTTFIFPFITLREKVDVSIIPNFTFLILKFKPTILIMHDLIEYNIPNKFSKLKMFYRTKMANPISSRIADKIITVSYNSKSDIIKFLNVPKEKIVVIYNGIDRNLFNNKSKNNNNELKDDFILYAGTIDHPGKNAYTVIKAFEKLKEVGRKHKLVLAGMPGKGFEELKQIIDKSKYKDDIIITGYVTDEQLVDLYCKCTVFCFVSLYEGFGIPPLEAIACGAEVIVSNNSSLPEVVGELGYKIMPTDELKLFECIENVIEGKRLNCDEFKRDEHLQKYRWDNISYEFKKQIISIKNKIS